jgi:hypothetical protein
MTDNFTGLHTPAKVYRHPSGKLIFASKVLGDNYCAVWRKPTGSLCRQRSPLLNVHHSFEAAQEELDHYAECLKWEVVTNA